MTIILNPISPEDAARESQALREAGEKVMGSAYLRRKFLKELGLEGTATKSRKSVTRMKTDSKEMQTTGDRSA